MKEIGIVGYGEIGESLEKCYLGRDFNVRIVDTGKGINQIKDRVDILNIAIPFTGVAEFVKIVSQYMISYIVKLYISNQIVKILVNHENLAIRYYYQYYYYYFYCLHYNYYFLELSSY